MNFHPERERWPSGSLEAGAGQAGPQVTIPPFRPTPCPPFLTSKLSAPHKTSSPLLLGLRDLLCVLFCLILSLEKAASRRPGNGRRWGGEGGGGHSICEERRLRRDNAHKKILSVVINAIQKKRRKEKEKPTPQSLKNTAH